MTLACPHTIPTEDSPPTLVSKYTRIASMHTLTAQVPVACNAWEYTGTWRWTHLNRPLHTRLELDVTKKHPHKTCIAKRTERGTQKKRKRDHGVKEGHEENTIEGQHK
ncbi:hypothetical protein JB92DRAFT_2828359 [Gautieria morchelliformis]|nr:hypothetical protein JB92DRAFT_2828359 [Gautieria morchelliformis]